MEPGGEVESRAELLANIRRLADLVLNRLEEGSREHTLDQDNQDRTVRAAFASQLWPVKISE